MQSQSAPPTTRTCEPLLNEARAALAAERLDEAAAFAAEAETQGLAHKALRCAARAAQLQAEAAWRAGRYAAAFASALRGAQQLGEALASADRVRCLELAALAACSAGLPEEGLPLAAQAVALADRQGLFESLAAALAALAHVQAHLGEFGEAERLHLQALSRARESADGQILVRSYANALMAGVFAHQAMLDDRQFDRAAAWGQRLLLLANQARRHLDEPFMSPWQRAVLRLNIAHGLLCGGRLDEAAQLLEQARQLSDSLSSAPLRDSLAHALCEVELRQDRLEQAAARVPELLRHLGDSSNAQFREQVLRTARALALRRGRAEQAERLAQQLAEVVEDQRRQRLQAAAEIRAAQQSLRL